MKVAIRRLRFILYPENFNCVGFTPESKEIRKLSYISSSSPP